MNSESRQQGSSHAGSERPIRERRYHKPPVIEALCEIYFAGSVWDETIPGAFYERVKSDFPKKQQRTIQEAQFTLGPEQAAAGVRQLPSWMQFISDEKGRMIQIAQDLLVVNQLAPYPHFEEWEPEVYRSLNAYSDLAQPRKVARLGFRYINQIVIPQDKVRMQEYFTIYPNLPEGLGDTYGSFMVRVEVPEMLEGHTMLITFGTALPPKPDEVATAFTLDLYDIVQLDKPVDEEVLKKEVRQAHDNIVVAFEDSITDTLRSLFEPEEQR